MTVRAFVLVFLVLGVLVELACVLVALVSPRARAWRSVQALRGTPRHAAALADYWRRYR